MTPRPAALVLAALGAGCAGARIPASEIAPPQVVVDSIPRGAVVLDRNLPIGTTPLAVPFAEEKGPLRLTFVLEGFLEEPLEVGGAGAPVPDGGRAVAVLRPKGWPEGKGRIGADDAHLLAHAGSLLLQANRCEEAVAYYSRAAEVEPRLASAHRGLGICRSRMNEPRKALEAYRRYLLWAPEGPDAEAVRRIVSEAEGDIDVPLPKQKREGP